MNKERMWENIELLSERMIELREDIGWWFIKARQNADDAEFVKSCFEYMDECYKEYTEVKEERDELAKQYFEIVYKDALKEEPIVAPLLRDNGEAVE